MLASANVPDDLMWYRKHYDDHGGDDVLLRVLSSTMSHFTRLLVADKLPNSRSDNGRGGVACREDVGLLELFALLRNYSFRSDHFSSCLCV